MVGRAAVRPPRQRYHAPRPRQQARTIAAAVDEMEPAGWTVFDLRRLRHPEPAGIPIAWTRLIEGYDLLVLVPQSTPAALVQPAAPPSPQKNLP